MTPNIISDYSLSTSREDVLKQCRKMLLQRKCEKIYVVNAQILCEGVRDEGYRDIIRQGSVNLCDGINVVRMIKWTSGINAELYPGPDFFADVLIKEKLGELKHYFFGGSNEVSNALTRRFQGPNYKFHCPPFRASAELFDYESIAQEIKEFSPDLIWVGLGAPKQEKVIHKLAEYLNSGVLIGVGAAFNFHSGIPQLARAPKFIRTWHLEWLFRLCQEPRRIGKRQLRNLWYLQKVFFKYRR